MSNVRQEDFDKVKQLSILKLTRNVASERLHQLGHISLSKRQQLLNLDGPSEMGTIKSELESLRMDSARSGAICTAWCGMAMNRSKNFMLEKLERQSVQDSTELVASVNEDRRRFERTIIHKGNELLRVSNCFFSNSSLGQPVQLRVTRLDPFNHEFSYRLRGR